MFDTDVRDGARGRSSAQPAERRPPWQLLQQRKVAALELCASAFALTVAERNGSSGFSVIERATERVQLGAGIFDRKQIAPDAFERGLSAIRRLRDAIQRHAPEAVLAVASSALREARNGADFVERASRAAAVPICEIDGIEAARLRALGARAAAGLEGRRVALFHIGGDSTEVALADDGDCKFTASLPLGTLRARALHAGSIAAAGDTFLLEQHVAEALAPTLAHLQALGFDAVVLCCDAARGLLHLTLAESNGARDRSWLWSATPRLSLAALERLLPRLAAMPEASRTQLAGLPPQAVDTLLPSAIALRAILERLRVDTAEVTASGLREGLITDYLRKRQAGAQGRSDAPPAPDP